MTTDPHIEAHNDDTGDAADLLRYYRDGMDTYRQSSIEQTNKADALAARLEAAERDLADARRAMEFLANETLFGSIVAEYAQKKLAAAQHSTSGAYATEGGKPPALNEEDLDIETWRPGSITNQTMTNPVNPAVRITHIPTGISSVCQQHKSQIANKEQALRDLAEKVASDTKIASLHHPAQQPPAEEPA